ncbi:hypothetical protein WJX73_010513 [Symbiochloris irregularis]|uniref:PITH domain-containing protein n=1 Tax=Symbiochloris irregularis TaxID=706552 RepID=A0AAW1NPK4_9CHLO
MAAQTDLLDLIDWSSVECLNQQPSHPVSNALKQGYREDDGLFLESDTDDQLLIHVAFAQAVKLQGIVIKSVDTEGRAPRRIKLFTNRASLGFSEAADFTAVQEFELSEDDVKEGKLQQLKYVKFQAVNVLSIFIESSQGDEETTRVHKIAIFGNSGEKMNVSEIKKQGEES